MPHCTTSPLPDSRRHDSPARLQWQIWLTVAGLTLTTGAGLLALADIVSVLLAHHESVTWVLSQTVFAVVVAYFVYGACVYQLARLGYLRRALAHRPAPDAELATVFDEPRAPLVTALVPSYREEERIVLRTLLSAALQEYPRRRVVLLIDDPAHPTTRGDVEALAAARRLPARVAAMLAEPHKAAAAARERLQMRLTAEGRLDLAHEHRELAALQGEIAGWFEGQADGYAVLDPSDRLFVEITFAAPARRARADAAEVAAGRGPRDAAGLLTAYRRLEARFDVELTSFERKRYANLSHEANKAMNLNGYIGLLGRHFREARRGGSLVLEPAPRAQAGLSIPASEFLLVVDADSVLTPDYALRLVHVMRAPGNEDLAVAQTPYSAFPGATGAVERVAGATTDIQYVLHQGVTHYGGTYWVGANAIVRTAALADIAVHAIEGGHQVTRFIQDRTVIEDTESTVDLMAEGWRLHNYPERLAYSETPPDFGSLIVQRRRWANGGLIIFPKLVRHLWRQGLRRGSVARALTMTHYLTSLAVVNVGLLVVLGFSFEESMTSWWLPVTAVPYYLCYTLDLVRAGYRLRDTLGVYALNLVLIPVNLAGVAGSILQVVTKRKTPFGRTPKVEGRTRTPATFVLVEAALLLQFVAGVVWDVICERPLHAVLTAVNLAFLAYGVARFLGVRNAVDDVRSAWALRAAARQPRVRQTAARAAGLALAMALGLLAAPGAAAEVALTVDDLPTHGTMSGRLGRVEIAQAFIDTLSRQGLAGVVGFANASQLADAPEMATVLHRWGARASSSAITPTRI